ncbi:MAG: hypothetical protein JWM76_3580 [Pseudonocardiales bacterium]|nr:hypothetical protein [Pseudonocardiales bacterium]
MRSLKDTSRNRRSLIMASAVIAAGSLALSACSSGGGSSDSSGSSAITSATVASAIAQYLKPPTSVGTDVALTKKPPAGKTVAVLTCNISSCKSYLDAAQSAAKVLGWTVKPFTFDPTPEAILSQMKAAIASKPDGILINGQDSSIWKSAIPDAEAAKVPIVSEGSIDVVGGPIIATGTTSEQWSTVASVLGQFIATDSNGKANVLSYGLAPFKISMQIATDTGTAITKACSTCKVTVVPSQATAIGSGIPQDVVSRLQQNPSINYVSFSDGAMTPGVVAAIREAGLSKKVKIVGADAQGSDYTSILSGDEYGFVQFSVPSYTWQGMDALARNIVGDPQVTYTMPNQILTKATIGSESADDVLNNLPRDLSGQFSKLWLVG